MKALTIIALLSLAKSSFSQPMIIAEQNSGITQTLTSVSSNAFGTINTYAWVCGYSGTVLRTINGGTTWQNVSGNGIPTNIQLINIACIDGNTAITSGYIGSNTFAYRTSNAGANWVQVFTEANGFINAVCFRSSTAGLMMGDPVGGRWSLWKTFNGGITWDSSGLRLPQAGSEAGWNNSMHTRLNQTWFGTNNSKIYYSTNFGSPWTSQPTTGEVNSYALFFPELSATPEGFAGGAALLRTNNNGLNWNTQSATGTGNYGGITGGPYIITGNALGFFNLFSVRNSNIIYTSSNNGVNWSSLHTAPSGTYRHIGSNYLASESWAVRDNGGITYIYMSPAGINQISNEIPGQFSLNQNYPNPFNPNTVISYQIAASNFAKIKVYDILGNEITTLVNEKQNSGSYSVEFNGANYPSGIYYYKLEAGDFSEVRKMILLK